MIPSICKHKRYIRLVRNRAGHYGGLRSCHRHYPVWRKLRQTNLDEAWPTLAAGYSARGRVARCPVCLLRSCLAMMLCGVTSFDVWVAMMRDEPFYALISGFEPADAPGVGTFYDFQDRLLRHSPQGRTSRCRPYRRRAQGDKASHHQDKNDLRPHQNIINRLADRRLRRARVDRDSLAVLRGEGDLTALPRWQQPLQAIFYTSFVARSVALGLIDWHCLHVAGDGSKLPTWANSQGKKLCQCDNRGQKAQDHCRCHRAYRDPWARWGWDSYRECWVYGHSIYELTAYSLRHRCQLPLLVAIADGNRHDAVHALATLYHGRESLGLPIQTASLDAAHDAIGLFRLATKRWHMALVIPLNERNQDHLHYAGPLPLAQGVPICLADRPMKRWVFCPDRMRLKWRCPLAATKKSPDVATCPHFGHDCSGSSYGRVVYTYPPENYRLHTLIPRESALWQAHRDARSCAERSIKRKKYDCHLLQTRTAGRHRWFFRLVLAAMCQHIDAWLFHAPNAVA